MTPEISAPMESPERKSVMATGSGSTLPLLTSISTSARAGSVTAALMPVAIAAISSIVFRNFVIRFSLLVFIWRGHSEHLARIEIDNHVGPGLVFVSGKVVGRAARHRTASGFRGGSLDATRASAGDDLGAAFERAGR